MVSKEDILKYLQLGLCKNCPVKWLEGVTADRSAPKYLVVTWPVYDTALLITILAIESQFKSLIMVEVGQSMICQLHYPADQS